MSDPVGTVSTHLIGAVQRPPNHRRRDIDVEREKALEMALGQIEKQFGKGSVMKMGEKGHDGDRGRSPPAPWRSTSPSASAACPGAGSSRSSARSRRASPPSPCTWWPRPSATAASAPTSTPSTPWTRSTPPAIGVDVDELLISQPDTGEQALEIADMLIRSGALDVRRHRLGGGPHAPGRDRGRDGRHATSACRPGSCRQALRKLTANLNKSDTICIFINQLREKIGVMFGSPETTPGGRALKFYSSVRLDIRRIESIKDGVEVVGNRTRVKVVKNKVAPPFKQAEFDIMYGQGISREGSLLDIGVDLGIVKKSGAWYTYEGEQLGQGRENAKEFLTENPEIMVEISDRILKAGRASASSEPDGSEDAAGRRGRPRRPADHPRLISLALILRHPRSTPAPSPPDDTPAARPAGNRSAGVPRSGRRAHRPVRLGPP